MILTRTLIAISLMLIITIQYNENKELKERNKTLEESTETSMQIAHNLKDSLNNK